MDSPATIDRYPVQELLGSGAFATVWLARDPILDVPVAIKVLADNWSRDHSIRDKFLSEARILWDTESRRVVRVHNVGQLETGQPFMVMTYADRGTLAERIDERLGGGGVFSIAEATAIAAELARCLSDVHRMGHIHRDVKPSNVLIRSTSVGGGTPVEGLAPDERVLLGDFGFARGIDRSAFTQVVGSPGFVSPEQAGGLVQLTEQTDLYPIGIIVLTMLGGDEAMQPLSMKVASQARKIDVKRHLSGHDPAVHAQLEPLLESLLDPDPNARPVSAADVANSLDRISAFASGMPESFLDQSGRAPTTASLAGAAPSRSTWPWLAAGVLSILVVAVAAYATLRSTGDETRPTSETAIVAGDQPTSTADADASQQAAPTVAEIAGPTSAATSTESTPAAAGQTMESAGGDLSADAQSATVPLPQDAVVDFRASDDGRTVAVIAANIDDVVSFYTNLDDPDWRVVETGPAKIVLAFGDRTADITIEATAQTASAGIARITAVYGP